MLRLHAGLLPPGPVPGSPSPQLDEARPQLGAGDALLCSVGRRGGCGVGVGGLASAAAALFVLDERQDVGEGEGPAALAAGQEVTTLVGSPDLWRSRRRRLVV